MMEFGTKTPPLRNLSSPLLLLIIVTGAGGVIAQLVLTNPPLSLVRSCTPIFNHLLYIYDAPTALISLLVFLVAIATSPFCNRLFSFAAVCGRHPWRLAVLAGIALAFGARYVYHAHPLSMDEYAVWFQSRVFASGKLAGQFPPEWLDRLVPPGFQNYFLAVSHSTGEVASTYWPGFALVMAPFSLIGAEWLCNPVLAALSVAAIAHTCRLVFPEDEGVAGWAMLFTLASPAFVAMGISYYAMTALLLANLVFTWGFFKPTPWRLFLTGIIGSIALTLHNPLPHILFAAPWLLWFICQRTSWRQLLALAAGYAPLSLLLGIGWMLFKGHLQADFSSSLDGNLPSDPVSIVKQLPIVFFPPIQEVINVLYIRLAGTIKLWIWALPGLLVLTGLGYKQRRENIPVQLLGASAVLTFAGYFIVTFDQGHGWGYRYFHPAWSVLPILAGAAVAGKSGDYAGGRFWTLQKMAGALTLGSLLILVPWQLRNIEGFISAQLAQEPAAPTDKRSVVFLYPEQGFYLMDLVQNDPFLRSNSLRMVGKGEREDQEFLNNAHIKAVPLSANSFGQAWLIQ